MKFEINIEIERTTIINKQSPKHSDIENTDDVIEVEANEITNLGLPPNTGDNNNEN